jgi:hypothetical protein
MAHLFIIVKFASGAARTYVFNILYWRPVYYALTNSCTVYIVYCVHNVHTVHTAHWTFYTAQFVHLYNMRLYVAFVWCEFCAQHLSRWDMTLGKSGFRMVKSYFEWAQSNEALVTPASNISNLPSSQSRSITSSIATYSHTAVWRCVAPIENHTLYSRKNFLVQNADLQFLNLYHRATS